MTLDLDLSTQLPTHSVSHAQWRLESLQMINWGGFEGPHQVRFAPGSTLISGGSGTGKSTVLDAYLALMMPSDTPFNGASNDAGGRARSPEQRNLLTYLRGKMDDKSEGLTNKRDLVLRGGDGEPVWGALGSTFVNDDERRFTVVRLYFLKAGARNNSDVTTTLATFDGSLDLTRFEPLAAGRFHKDALKKAIPGIEPHPTFWQFEQKIHAHLGIGTGDGGRKAMRLLARMQAGMQIQRVDGLYKTMVLEEPSTYRAADAAIAHFADLEASYTKMLDEAAKMQALRRLPDLQRELSEAAACTQLIDQFGVDLHGPSPFLLWQLQTERRLLDDAVVQNRSDHQSAVAEAERALTAEDGYKDELTRITEQKLASGGGAIDERRREISRLSATKDTVYAANLKFQTRTEPIGLVVPQTQDQFNQAQTDAVTFLAGFDLRETALLTQEEDVRDQELSPLTTRQRELMQERTSLQGRNGAVPSRLHSARVKMAEAAGLDPMKDLPFVAELMDVLPEEEHWRKAVETTLGGLARTVLVDERTRDHLSEAIEPLRIRPRINFEAVTLTEHQVWRGDPDQVSGKLEFKESPFSGWVQDRVSNPDRDHLCVPAPRALGGRGPRVTPSGQTRRGSSGAHGESGDGYIIGFSGKRRLEDIENQLFDLDPQIRDAKQKVDQVRQRLTSLRLQKEAHTLVQDTTWESIDHLGLDRRIEELGQEIDRLRAANSILDALQAEEERIKPLLERATRERVLAQDLVTKLGKQHGDLVTRQDSAQDGIDAIDQAQTSQVTDEQRSHLDELFTARWASAGVDSFRTSMTAMRGHLRDEAATARRSAASATTAMETMFEGYQRQWPEHNLGVTVDSADGFREILDRIASGGLHERRDRWRRELAAWSSDDLLRLHDAFETALDDIEDRLHPINTILENLPFGGKGILQINLRRLQSEDVATFRRGLRELSSGLALELTDQQVAARFKKLREFMGRISIPEGHTKSSTSQRDRYLDVRQHVVITARCLDSLGQEVATYDHVAGGKSGGEMQELVAFIVGSALRYQLGDESRSRPRFAPVLLDEGFVKADGEFSGRAVAAWQDLGFQLVIGAPLDKVTAIEPHMDLLLAAVKSPAGYSFVVDLKDAPQVDHEDEGTGER